MMTPQDLANRRQSNASKQLANFRAQQPTREEQELAIEQEIKRRGLKGVNAAMTRMRLYSAGFGE